LIHSMLICEVGNMIFFVLRAISASCRINNI
jgi:hypothetical protein